QSDIFRKERGGEGPGSVTEWGLNPKYLPPNKGDICVSPLASKKGGQSSVRKGGQSSVRKGGHVPQVKCPYNKYKEKEESAAAASAVASPPPPLLTEEDLAAAARFRVAFKERHGRELLGGNVTERLQEPKPGQGSNLILGNCKTDDERLAFAHENGFPNATL